MVFRSTSRAKRRGWTGTGSAKHLKDKYLLMLPRREEKAIGDREVVRRIAGYLGNQKARTTAALFLTVAAAASFLAFPVTMKTMVEDIQAGRAGRIWVDALLILFFLGLNALFSWAYASVVASTSARVIRDLRVDLFGAIQHADVALFSERAPGEILSVTSNDVDLVEKFVSGTLFQLAGDACLLAMSCVVFFQFSPLLSVVLVTLLVVQQALEFLAVKRTRGAYRESRLRVEDLTSHLEESIAGSRVIKAYCAEEEEIGAFTKNSAGVREAFSRAAKFESAYKPVAQVAGYLFTGVVVVVGAAFVQNGWGDLTVAELVAVLVLTGKLVKTMASVVGSLGTSQACLAAAERVFHLLDRATGRESTGSEANGRDDPGRDTPADNLVPSGELEGRVAFEHVTFAYPPGGVNALREVSFEVPAGSFTALVGRTGAGKSTLAKLLARFYEPAGGRVTLDGVDIREYDARYLRGVVGIALQENFLVPGTVMDNLRYALPGWDDEAVESHARNVGIDDLLTLMDLDYSTPVRQGGCNLSAGQRQAIATARVLLRDPRVLVLDEPTSYADEATERAVWEVISGLAAERTTIVIAHRLGMLERTDQVVVLDEGEVVERGTPVELAAKGGLYSQFTEKSLNPGAHKQNSCEPRS
ncbi:MAG: ABC transporter ATP-binding protein [Promethearchaeota archaeon]